MNEQDWLTHARSYEDKLAGFIAAWHPASDRFPYRWPPGPITAPGAEQACGVIRKLIREEHEGDPATQFRKALKDGDIGTANNLLNSAWFGVPESTSCWDIDGFREAVELMENLPGSDYDPAEEEK